MAVFEILICFGCDRFVFYYRISLHGCSGMRSDGYERNARLSFVLFLLYPCEFSLHHLPEGFVYCPSFKGHSLGTSEFTAAPCVESRIATTCSAGRAFCVGLHHASRRLTPTLSRCLSIWASLRRSLLTCSPCLPQPYRIHDRIPMILAALSNTYSIRTQAYNSIRNCIA